MPSKGLSALCFVVMLFYKVGSICCNLVDSFTGFGNLQNIWRPIWRTILNSKQEGSKFTKSHVLWCLLQDEGDIVLEGSRHPCVEAQDDVNFISNDCRLVLQTADLIVCISLLL